MFHANVETDDGCPVDSVSTSALSPSFSLPLARSLALSLSLACSLTLAHPLSDVVTHSVHTFVSTQVPLASGELKDPAFAMESCLHLLDAILAECHLRGHVALAAEEGEVGDTEVLEKFMVW